MLEDGILGECWKMGLLGECWKMGYWVSVGRWDTG